MSDVGKREYGPAAMANGAAADLFTVGAYTLHVRHIHILNTTAGALTATLSIGADGAATRFLDAYPIPAKGTYDWSGFMPMDTGEKMQGFGSGAGLTIIVSGVRVT